MSIQCFDVASEVIEEATNRFKPIMKLNTENLDIFKQYCEIIDGYANEFDGESFDINVDKNTMEITVALRCRTFIIEAADHVFYELIKRTVRYSFSTDDDGDLIVKFVFPSLWERACIAHSPI